MKKLARLAMCAVIALSIASPAMAISMWGKISEDLEYDNLSITKGQGYCTISGKVKNKKREIRDGVFIKIYAYNNQDTMLWSHLLFIKTLPASGEASFSERIYDCTEKDPYKMEFKVNE